MTQHRGPASLLVKAVENVEHSGGVGSPAKFIGFMRADDVQVLVHHDQGGQHGVGADVTRGSGGDAVELDDAQDAAAVRSGSVSQSMSTSKRRASSWESRWGCGEIITVRTPRAASCSYPSARLRIWVVQKGHQAPR